MYGLACKATHAAGVIRPYGPYIDSHGGRPLPAPPRSESALTRSGARPGGPGRWARPRPRPRGRGRRGRRSRRHRQAEGRGARYVLTEVVDRGELHLDDAVVTLAAGVGHPTGV